MGIESVPPKELGGSRAPAPGLAVDYHGPMLWDLAETLLERTQWNQNRSLYPRLLVLHGFANVHECVGGA